MNRRRGSEARHHARTAFTLVELVMSLAIVAMFAAVAVPRYANFAAHQRAQGAVRRIATDLALAKRRAVLSSSSQTVAFTVATDSYIVGTMMDPDRPADPYRVILAQEPYNATIVSADFGGDADLVFDGYGVADSGGTIVLRVGGFEKTITVSGTRGLIESAPTTKKLEVN